MDIIVTEVKIMASNDLIEMQGKVVGVNRNIFTVECIPNPEKPENTQKGLQVKTVFDEEAKAYVSTLWADNITKKANGNYYCVIEDNNGLSLQSSTVEIRVK